MNITKSSEKLSAATEIDAVAPRLSSTPPANGRARNPQPQRRWLAAIFTAFALLLAAGGAQAQSIVLTLSADRTAIGENGDVSTVTASLATTSTADTIITVMDTPGTGTTTSDYTLSATILTITAGNNTGTFTLTARNNDLDAPDKTVTVSATATNTQDTIVDSNSVIVTIEDDEAAPTVTLSVDSATIGENGDISTVTATVSPLSSAATTINVTATPGTGTTADDFILSANSFIIAAGVSTGTVTLTARNNDLDAPDKTVTVSATVTNPQVTIAAPASVMVTIEDDEAAPTVTLSVDSATIGENGDISTVTATVSPLSSAATTINVTATPGTGTTADDFILSANSFIIAAGVSTGTVTLTARNNDLDAPDKTVTVSATVTNPQVTIAAPASVMVTIEDDEAAPTVTLSVDSATIGENGDISTVTATVSPLSSAATTINVTATPGTGTTAGDFILSANSFIIAAGVSTGTVTLTARNNDLDAPDKTVTVSATVTNPQVTIAAPASVMVTIEDDEAAPTVTLSVDSATIGENGDISTVTATVSPLSSAATTINVTATPGTGTTAGDFILSANSFIIAAGVSTGTVTLTARNNDLDAPDKTVTVSATVTNPQVTIAAPASVMVTIEDDEAAPTVTLSVDSATIGENGDISTVTATVSPLSSAATTINVTATPGTGTTADDFILSANSFIIAAGVSTGTVTLTARNNDLDAPDKTVTVSATVTNPQVTIAAPASVMVTIEDDEAAPTVTLSVDSATIGENGDISTVTATVSPLSSAATTINVTATPGTGTTAGDFILSANSFIIAAGVSTGTVTLTARNNDLDAPDKTVTVSATVTNPQVTIAAPASVMVTIEDDEAAPTVTLSAAPATIGENGGVSTVTATLSPLSSVDTTINVTATPGSGATGSDYTLSATTFTIAAGVSTGMVTLTAENNDVDAANKTVSVSAIATNALPITDSAPVTVTIEDDEAAPTVTLSATPTTINEDGGTSTVTATLSHPSSVSTTIVVTATAGTDTMAGDFILSGTTLTIAAGATDSTDMATLIAVNNDTDSPPQVKEVTLSANADNAIGITLPVSVTLNISDVSLTYAGRFTESVLNDGIVTGSITATLNNDTFALESVITDGVSVAATNVPDGLTAEFARTNDTTVTLTLSGTADAHEAANNVSALTITFNGAAFVLGDADTVANLTYATGEIDFRDVSTLVYAGTFTESDLNDGTVTGSSITAILTSDTFATEVATDGSVTATNVPDGLTAEFARTDATTVTLTLTGTADAHEHANDVSDLTITFTDTAFAQENAATITGLAYSTGVIDFRDASTLVYAGTFTESTANDGTVTGSITATLAGDTFAAESVITNGTSVTATATNFPTGLTAAFTRTNDNVVTLTLTGTAAAHESANNVSDLTITFNDAAFALEGAATIAASTYSTGEIDFEDASTLTYAGRFTETSANNGTVTGSITATLSGDTFHADVVASTYVTASNVPDSLTAVFTRTNDTVVTLTLTGTADVHLNGNNVRDLTIEFTDDAFVLEGTATIAASTYSTGEIDFGAGILTYVGSFTEVDLNDGTVSSSITATLTGDTFAVESVITNGTSVTATATNFPAGLTTVFTRTGDTTVTLTLTGTADDHEDANDVSDLTITFTDDAFTTNAANAIVNSIYTTTIDFRDQSTLTYAGTFTESASNDGSVTGSITATLTGDTFDVESVITDGSSITATVPAGLTAVFARTNDTVVTLTLTGTADDHKHVNDVSDLTITFTDDAFAQENAATIDGSIYTTGVIDFNDASLVYDDTDSFMETDANDGSVTGSITATLDGDIFADDVVTRGHVTATNVPDGLIVAFIRNSSGTEVTLTLTGTATTHADANDVDNLAIEFTDAAFAAVSVATVLNPTYTTGEIDFRDASALTYEYTDPTADSFTEVDLNNGAVTGTITATLTGDTTFAADVASDGSVIATNIPAGLTAMFTRTSGTMVTLTLTGNAIVHEDSNDVSDLTIIFEDTAFALESADTIAASTYSTTIDFRDASTLTYAGSFTETVANDGTVTGSITATLAGDTFAASVATDGSVAVTSTTLPSGLTASFALDSTNTVVTLTLTGNATAHEDTNDVSNLTITFTDAAFMIEGAATIDDSAYTTGEIDFHDAASLTYDGEFTESTANDGTVTGSITATLNGETFADENVITDGISVTASNVPDDLIAVFARTSDTVVTLTLTGTATAHENGDDVNLTITFAPDAFISNRGVANTSSNNAIDFRDASVLSYTGSFTESDTNDGLRYR